MKAESEMAAKLLEKDIHEKQDTIISLRQQLDDIKEINLEMYHKLMVSELIFYSTKFGLCMSAYEPSWFIYCYVFFALNIYFWILFTFPGNLPDALPGDFWEN